MKTKVLKLADIQPATYNPRKDLKPGDSQYEAIKNSIDEFGFVEPLIVNQRNNTLVGGHQRYKILIAQGVEETEAVLVDLDEQDERALNIALNKIDGEWDNGKLQDLLKELQQDDVLKIGFSQEECESLLKEIEDEGQETEGDSGQENAQDGADGDFDGGDEQVPTDENKNATGPFEVYLSFPTEAAAAAWLEAHGIEKEFDSARNVIIDYTKEAQEE